MRGEVLKRLLREVGRKSILIYARLSHLKHGVLVVVSVLGVYSNGKVTVRSVGSRFSLASDVGSGVVTFTFTLTTRVREGLVSRQAGRTLTIGGLRNIELKHPPKGSGRGIAFYGRCSGVVGVETSKRSVASVTGTCKVREGALGRCLSGVGLWLLGLWWAIDFGLVWACGASVVAWGVCSSWRDVPGLDEWCFSFSYRAFKFWVLVHGLYSSDYLGGHSLLDTMTC